jgi:aryl-alcohol dehydrogenase-like predicted oxidoreductase
MEDPIEEIIEAFEKLKASGKIRYYGISSIRPKVIREWVNKSGMVSVMMQYSLLDRRPEEEVFPLLRENQIGVLARGVLAKGILVSKPAEPFLNYPVEKVEQIRQQLKDISLPPFGPADRAVHFAIDNPAVSAAVIGIRTREQLRTAVDAGHSPALNILQSAALRNHLPPNTYTDHR